MRQIDKIRGALLGLSVADALGVPYEFLSRAKMRDEPATDMRGYGTHMQPAGTWSDDSSLAFCTAESLSKGYNLRDMGRSMVRWFKEEAWTPHGRVFDIGIATSKALHRLRAGATPEESGLRDEKDNGNGSLMRILPLLFAIQSAPIDQRWQCTAEVSGLTHAHIRSQLACFIYLEYARLLAAGMDKFSAFTEMQTVVNDFLDGNAICTYEERNVFHRLLQHPVEGQEIRPVHAYSEDEIQSSGYVVHTLEAAFWCFLRYDDYRTIALAAVNLAEDTDTTACVAGGLAGLYLGEEAIPADWRHKLQRREDIEALAEALAIRFPN